MTTVLLDENLPFDLIELFEQYDFFVYHIKKLGKAHTNCLFKKVITFSERQLIVIYDNGITIKTSKNA